MSEADVVAEVAADVRHQLRRAIADVVGFPLADALLWLTKHSAQAERRLRFHLMMWVSK